MLLVACSTPGYRGLWQPKPAELLVTDANGAPIARLAVAVLGKWRGEPYDGEVHVRLRVENTSTVPLRLPVARCELFSGDLVSFGEPRLVGGSEEDVPPAGTGLLDVGFGPAPEGCDLRGLQARWVLMIADRESPGAQTFAYASPEYVPYYGSLELGWYWGWPSHSSTWSGGGSVKVPSPKVLPPHVTSLPPKK